jgi:hypothetical protein
MSGTAFLPAFAARTHGAEKGRQGRYCLEEENGAQGQNRTADTAIFSRMLYQLSYLGMP